ncbi:MAG TPA: type II CAAX endopeptidase family protein [Spirochaetia bacterium]|nr:type II CAAX endopeptidase family protein [Spirochaetia bacterium]
MEFDGRWERDGRNPLAAALLLVIGAGTFYFLAQSLLLNGYIMFDELLRKDVVSSPDLGTAMRETYRRYRVPILTVLALTQFLLLFLVTITRVRVWHTRKAFAYLGFTKFPVGGILLGVAGVLTLLPAVEYLGHLIYSLVPNLRNFGDSTSPLVTATTPGEYALILFAIAVTPAICEETLFRGYFQRTLQRRMSAPWHYLLSGTLFALFHQRVLSLPSLILVGVYLGFLFSRYNSIYTTMASHFAYNGTLIVLANSALRTSRFVNADGFTLTTVEISLALFAVVTGVIVATTRGSVPSAGDSAGASTVAPG